MMIDKFVNQLSTVGLSRTNSWEIRIYPPKGLTGFQTGQVGGSRVNANLPGLDLSAVSGQERSSLTYGFDDYDINVGYNLGTPVSGYSLQNTNGLTERLSLYTESCQIPERDINNFEFSEYGETRIFGHKHVHTPVAITHFCSESLLEYEFFKEWQNIIFNSNTKQYSYYDNYTSTMEIIKYNFSWSDVEAVYRFEEVYPTRVGAISLRAAGTEPVRIQIIMNFRKYERIS